jgi:hypothetical protein
MKHGCSKRSSENTGIVSDVNLNVGTEPRQRGRDDGVKIQRRVIKRKTTAGEKPIAGVTEARLNVQQLRAPLEST